MTKQNINVRNLQHVDGKLIYKNYNIIYEVIGSSVHLEAESVIDYSILSDDGLESLLDKIDEITNM